MKKCCRCGYYVPANHTACGNCGESVLHIEEWYPGKPSRLPQQPNFGALWTGEAWSDKMAGFLLSIVGHLVYIIVLFIISNFSFSPVIAIVLGIGGLLVILPALYYYLHDLYPMLARGLGFGILGLYAWVAFWMFSLSQINFG